MKIRISISTVHQTKTHEVALRFVLGGVATALAGLVAMKFGPVIGGLFLAFPAIFPASITLAQKHEVEKKRMHGMNGEKRGRLAVGIEAAGATLGSIGLMLFGLVVWQLAPHYSAWQVLSMATMAWFAFSASLWIVRKKL